MKKQQPAMIESKPITCKRCGHDDCAWSQSSKTGKWYLVEGGYCHPDLKGTGFYLFNRFNFHKCRENPINFHKKTLDFEI